MPKHIILLLATLSVAAGFHEWRHPTTANAASTCSMVSTHINQSTPATQISNEIDGSWDVKCNHDYNVKIVIQYSDSNGWHNAQCDPAFGNPCADTKPTSGWFNGGDEHMGNRQWFLIVPGNICNNHLFRIRLIFTFANGDGGLTVNPSGTNIGC